MYRQEKWVCIICGKEDIALKDWSVFHSPNPVFICRKCHEEQRKKSRETTAKIIMPYAVNSLFSKVRNE